MLLAPVFPSAAASPVRLEPADAAWAAPLLAAAYAPQGTPAWLAAGWLRYALCFGRAYANAERTAVALWLVPGHPRITWAGQLQSGLVLAALRHLGWAGAWRHWQAQAVAEQAISQSAPAELHHRLLSLAVLPTAQGRDVGHRLLRLTCAVVQACAPLPCYVPARRLHDSVPSKML